MKKMPSSYRLPRKRAENVQLLGLSRAVSSCVSTHDFWILHLLCRVPGIRRARRAVLVLVGSCPSSWGA